MEMPKDDLSQILELNRFRKRVCEALSIQEVWQKRPGSMETISWWTLAEKPFSGKKSERIASIDLSCYMDSQVSKEWIATAKLCELVLAEPHHPAIYIWTLSRNELASAMMQAEMKAMTTSSDQIIRQT